MPETWNIHKYIHNRNIYLVTLNYTYTLMKHTNIPKEGSPAGDFATRPRKNFTREDTPMKHNLAVDGIRSLSTTCTSERDSRLRRAKETREK
jgi:hypothetical protein